MKKRLQIIGAHPAGMWLAIYLFHRAWLPELKLEQKDFQPNWIPFYSGFYSLFGETEPRWPLEWCWQELYGISEIHEQELRRLRALKVHLLDGFSMNQEMQNEWVDISKQMAKTCFADDSGDCFRVEVKWAEAKNSPELAWEQVGQLKNIVLPTGLLGVWHSQTGGKLALAPLKPGAAAYTYQCLEPNQAEADFRALLSQALPNTSISAGALHMSLRSLVRQWPQIDANSSFVSIIIPRPALRADNMIMQGVSWLLIQSLACWLAEGLTRFEDLGSRLQNFLEKIQLGLGSMAQSDKYLRIMD